MASAEVGDDVFGEDPTVARLEAMSARIVGKQAAVFVPSGTMANLAALLAHCGRGDEIILGDRSHTFLYEAGGSAALGGIHPRPLANRPNGTIDLAEMAAAVRADNVHFPVTRLVCLESTHNRCGGSVLDLDYLASVRTLADRHDLKVHLDGARLFNAAVASGIPASTMALHVDSVTFCLSKGLAAPIGSVLCGGAAFVERARRSRKILGGGMRQAGVIAAAGIVALETMVDRLADDHANASALAHGLAGLPGVDLDPASVRTNIVIFGLQRQHLTPERFADRLAEHGVRMLAIGGQSVRAVTHYEVTPDDIATAVDACRRVLAG
jgi:threonine aldolase